MIYAATELAYVSQRLDGVVSRLGGRAEGAAAGAAPPCLRTATDLQCIDVDSVLETFEKSVSKPCLLLSAQFLFRCKRICYLGFVAVIEVHRMGRGARAARRNQRVRLTGRWQVSGIVFASIC